MKDCKYFKSGRGKCPFGNKCFYLHAYPDGTKADVGPPLRQRRHNADGDIDVLQVSYFGCRANGLVYLKRGMIFMYFSIFLVKKLWCVMLVGCSVCCICYNILEDGEVKLLLCERLMFECVAIQQGIILHYWKGGFDCCMLY